MLKTAIICLILLLAANAVLAFSWMEILETVDFVFHFLGGLFTAMLLSGFYRKELEKLSLPVRIFSLVGMALIVGVVWEFAEYIAQHTLVEYVFQTLGVRTYFLGDIHDTLNDLLMDILGSGFLALLVPAFGRKKADLPVSQPVTPRVSEISD